MTAQEIRAKYLAFFKTRKHKVIPRALLVPNDDPTTLFTGSGMQSLIPYLLGQTHPKGKRLVDSQTCFRAEDMDEVGDNRHTTFFEMLGNWSLGDYFKAEQLPWFFEFLTDVVGLDPTKLYVTCFIGDDATRVPKDTQSSEVWQKLFNSKNVEAKTGDIGSEENGYKRGMKPGERIFYYDASKNWWSRGGLPADMAPGEPGGPDSEVFYDFGTEHDVKFGENCHPNCDCGRFLEIGNSVFMTYKKTERGFEKLPEPNVDFGGGLERIASASEGSGDMFKISLLWPIIECLESITGKKYDSSKKSMQVIADHLRAATFLVVDGVVPSNKEQGYVLRRLIRRATRFAHELGIEQDLSKRLVPVVVDLYSADFPEVAQQSATVVEALDREEKLFRQTLKKGLKEFEKTLGSGSLKSLDGEKLFKLYDTFGFPIELSIEEATKRRIEIPEGAIERFEELLEEQKDRSRTAGKGVFKGGLADHSEQVTKYHTATHLMYQALRDTLGSNIIQRGSNITGERIRFDFSYPEKLTAMQIKQVEDIVNSKISQDLPVSWREEDTKVAFEKGAFGAFGDKYGDTVKVYTIGDDKKPYSREICGGPHVSRTGLIGEKGKSFKIIKEESSSAGIRRVKAAIV